MWREHGRMEGAIKVRYGRRGYKRAEPSELYAVPGGGCFSSAGDPFMPLQAIAEGTCHNCACVQLHRQSMLKQPESAFEILLYCFIVIAASKCF